MPKGYKTNGSKFTINTGKKHYTISFIGIDRMQDEITRWSAKLSQKYNRNSQFPSELGTNVGRPTAIISEEIRNIWDAIAYAQGRTKNEVDIDLVINSYERLRELYKSIDKRKDAFFGYVSDYYSETRLTRKQTIDALKKKKFKIPLEDIKNNTYYNEANNYERMRNWIYSNTKNSSRKALNKINNSNVLRAIMQEIELFGTIPTDIAQRYVRKGKKIR